MRSSGGWKPGGPFYSGANGPPKLQSADVSAVWCCSHAHRLACSKTFAWLRATVLHGFMRGNLTKSIIMWPEKSRFSMGSTLDVLCICSERLPSYVRHGDRRDTIQRESIKKLCMYICRYMQCIYDITHVSCKLFFSTYIYYIIHIIKIHMWPPVLPKKWLDFGGGVGGVDHINCIDMILYDK